jgi:ferrous iron transport protein B
VVAPQTVALVGNPNAGKSTLFNALTGRSQKVGNYPGVTVARATGRFYSPHGEEVRAVDLPGAYSLSPQAPDEEVTYAVLHGTQAGEARPDVVVCVVDASALERHLPMVAEVAELGIPTVVALNRVDLAEAAGVKLDPRLLSERFGVEFVPCVAHRKVGLVTLKHAIGRAAAVARPAPWEPEVGDRPDAEARARARFEFARGVCQEAARRRGADGPPGLTDRLDRVVLHPVAGWVVFLGLMFLTFWALFSWAEAPMGWIEGGVAAFGEWVRGLMPPGDLRSLLVDGVIAGVGGVLVFLPQIAILFFLIGLLESTGYMARAAYLMDGPMSKAGLTGRSFIPLLSSYACAIPGVMAARTIGAARARLITILIAPWMSCSARLPVYALMIALLFPAGAGPLTKPLVLFALYATGTLTALVAARLLRARLGGDAEAEAHFLLEFPDYHAPRWGYVLRHTAERAWAFVRKAGTLILGLSVLIWAASTYPRAGSDDQAEQLVHSAMGRAGRAIEPAVEPLGFDWRIGVGVLTSFAAREVFNSTMAITFAVDDEEDIPRLRDAVAAATWPDGRKLFTPLTCISLLVFYIYALQCLPTTAVVRRETGSWKVAVGQFVGMGAFAYLASLVVYQGGRLLGLG